MTTKPSLKYAAFLGGLTAVPVAALLYLAEQFAGLPFVPFDLFDWLARVLPGDVITLGIDAIVRTITTFQLGQTDVAAKFMEQGLALVMFLLLGMLLGLLVAWLIPRLEDRPAAEVGIIAAGLFLLLVLVAEWQLGWPADPTVPLLWLAGLWLGWGILLGKLVETDPASENAEPLQPQTGRRAVLAKLAAVSAGVAISAYGLGRLFRAGRENTGAAQPLADLPATPPAGTPTSLEERIEPAPGTRPEVTANENFYRIDINTRSPVIEQATWQLEVAGLFDNPRPLTLADLMAMPAVTQPITLSCISNQVGGDLISTSYWTGVRLVDLLEELGLQAGARELFVSAADGFYESVVMADMMDPRTLLVYGMNEETLPVEHGFPLRIYIPNRYGMKQPKWITRIEATDDSRQGYWVLRGWSREARPQIQSVIDTVAEDELTAGGLVPVGGIAYAGDRGIQKVEVQVDEGEWVAAVLREPTLGPLTWVQWRYDWPAEPGRHTLRVRATDGTGTLQTEDEQDMRPSGATGYHQLSVRI